MVDGKVGEDRIAKAMREGYAELLETCRLWPEMWSFRVTDVLSARWKISDQAIAKPVGDEMVVLHLSNGTYYGLDPVGVILWEALTQNELPSQACEAILARFDVERATVEDDLRHFLGELVESGLVVSG